MRLLSPFLLLVFAMAAFSADAGFRPLFNGKDLTNWHLVDAFPDRPSPWVVKDGVLSLTPKTKGWLSSDHEFDNFHLKFEFKIGPRGNSGVWLRSPEYYRQSRLGFEYQIYDDNKPPHKGSTAALYDCVPPSKAAWKPAGEWNQAEAICNKSKVVFMLNGEKVIDVDFDDPELNAKLPETHKLNKRHRKGHLGLTNHGDPVEFRNIVIKEM